MAQDGGNEASLQWLEDSTQAAPYCVLPALLYLKKNGVKGNENYGLALQSAKQLKQAIHDNNAEQIAQLSEQTKIYINNYTSTKYNQWINDDKPNKKGFKRIGAMNALASIVDTAAAYGRNLEGISNDISAQNTYNQALQDDKQAIADAKAQQQSKLCLAFFHE